MILLSLVLLLCLTAILASFPEVQDLNPKSQHWNPLLISSDGVQGSLFSGRGAVTILGLQWDLWDFHLWTQCRRLPSSLHGGSAEVLGRALKYGKNIVKTRDP